MRRCFSLAAATSMYAILLLCKTQAQASAKNAFAPGSSSNQYGFGGELLITTKGCQHAHDHSSKEHDLDFTYALLSETDKVHLVFESNHTMPTQDLLSGMKARVTGERVGSFFHVQTMQLQREEHVHKRMLASRVTERVTSITYILNICGQSSPTTKEDHERLYRSAGDSLQGYISDCSYGKTTFLPEDNIVIGPIDIPCEGETSHGKFDSQRCGDSEIYGWAQVAEDEARQQNKDIDFSAFKRRFIVLPDMHTCGWGGLATLGCGRVCIAWVNGHHAKRITTFFHELGHTFGLMHSGTPGQEYGDCSCAMSNCGGKRCFNVAQSWNLGWVSPIEEIASASLQPGVWEKHFLPAVQVEPSSTYDRNFLRITLTDLEEPGAVFVSYRERQHGDSGLYSTWSREVHIHTYSGEQRQTKIEPTLRERLSTNQQWDSSDLLGSDEMAGLVVSFDGIRGSFAAVRVCRYQEDTDECDLETSPVRDKSPSCLDGNSRGTKSQEGNDGAQIKDASNLRWADDEAWKESCDSAFTTSDGSGRESNKKSDAKLVAQLNWAPMLIGLALSMVLCS